MNTIPLPWRGSSRTATSVWVRFIIVPGWVRASVHVGVIEAIGCSVIRASSTGAIVVTIVISVTTIIIPSLGSNLLYIIN